MSLRWKIALAMAVIASVATIAIGTASYRESRARLLDEVDRSLVEVQQIFGDRRFGQDPLPERGPLAGFDAQVLSRDGVVLQSTFPEPLSVGDEERSVLGTPRASVFTTVEADGSDYRVRTIGINRGAVQVGRSLAETERVLQSLRARVLLWVVLVAAAATLAGWWIAGRVTASLRRLTEAAEHVEATGRLDVTVDDDRSDEVGRLAVAFDRMLAALARSRDDQQRLVQDAGHELRTPLTSLRTNLDTLRRYPDLDTPERSEIVDALHAETEELTDLVNEIVAVASGSVSDERFVEFDLGEVTGDVAARYRRRGGREIDLVAEVVPVVGQLSSVHRAVSCLIDNACKFDEGHAPIELRVRTVDGAAEVAVSDRGPGIDDADLELVFERFHRADEARTLPGSGLGLSIVREVARRHGGDAFAYRRSGGGVTVGFRMAHAPVRPTPPPALPPPPAG